MGENNLGVSWKECFENLYNTDKEERVKVNMCSFDSSRMMTISQENSKAGMKW